MGIIARFRAFRAIAKNPLAGFAFIEGNPKVWKITKVNKNRFPVPADEGGVHWIGPFNLTVPGYGHVQFYGREDLFEQELEDIRKRLMA